MEASKAETEEPIRKVRVRPPMLTNQQLVAAMGHPTRAHAVTVLNERVACAAEIGREIGKTARHVSYHLGQLKKLGVIEAVKVGPIPGTRRTATFYRALHRSWYDPESWKQVDPDSQPGITAGILSACNADLAAAMKSGTIHATDSHISRTPLLLDPAGYRRIVDRLDELLPEVIELQQRAAARMNRSGDTVLAKAHIIQFPSPDAGIRAIGPIASSPAPSTPPDVDIADVLSALEHPTRVHALMVLNERIASASELGRELDRPSDHVAYHLKKLKKIGMIELVHVEETSGGRKTGRFYRARVRPWFDQASWEKVDPRRQGVITATMLGLCNADVAEAVRSGTIDEPDSHISRTPLILDRDSYADLGGLLDAVIEEMLKIQEEASARIRRETDAEVILTKVHMFLFESPDPAGN